MNEALADGREEEEDARQMRTGSALRPARWYVPSP